jgi:hypothetical protein
MAIWSILLPFGIVCGLLVYYMNIWHTFSRFGMLYQKNLATLIESRFPREIIIPNQGDQIR